MISSLQSPSLLGPAGFKLLWLLHASVVVQTKSPSSGINPQSSFIVEYRLLFHRCSKTPDGNNSKKGFYYSWFQRTPFFMAGKARWDSSVRIVATRWGGKRWGERSRDIRPQRPSPVCRFFLLGPASQGSHNSSN